MVDALASGASGLKVVEVRVFSWAPYPSTFLMCWGIVVLGILTFSIIDFVVFSFGLLIEKDITLNLEGFIGALQFT